MKILILGSQGQLGKILLNFLNKKKKYTIYSLSKKNFNLLNINKLKKKYIKNKKIMSYNEIKKFIMFYQRITLQMIKDLGKSAAIVIFLKKNHEIKKVLYRI